MNIKPFQVEQWMNEYEVGAKYNIAETCVDSISLDELFAITKEDKTAFFNTLSSRRLTYGDIWGVPELKNGICKLYQTLSPDHVVTTHGAAGANHHVFYSLVEPGDKVISVLPTYQQLYSIPESFGAKVELLPLRQENGFLPDLHQLSQMATQDTKVICLNNPNNPTGALLSKEQLEEIVAIARKVDAYVLCDEVYRGLTQSDEPSVSIADLYEKGISVSSMSKVFSLAGIRLGWIASRDEKFMESCLSHRDYDHISCGILDEAVAALALKHAPELLARNRGIVRENLALLDDWVRSQPHVYYTKPQAGTTALVYYDFPIPSYTFCKQMYEATGAFVTPGDCFEQANCMRIGYACEKQVLADGLRAIDAFIKQLEA